MLPLGETVSLYYVCGENAAYVGSVLSEVSGFHWGSWNVCPTDTGGRCISGELNSITRVMSATEDDISLLQSRRCPRELRTALTSCLCSWTTANETLCEPAKPEDAVGMRFPHFSERAAETSCLLTGLAYCPDLETLECDSACPRFLEETF